MARGPAVELDWEERAFRGLLWLWRKLAPERVPPPREEAARLDGDAEALGIVAHVLAGRPVRVLPAAGHGGVRGTDLLVPAAFDMGGTAEENREARLLRVAIGATVIRLGLSETAGSPGERALASLVAFRIASERLAAELPDFAGLLSRSAMTCSLATPWETLRAAALDLSTPWTPPSEPPAGDPGVPSPIWGDLVPVEGSVEGAKAADTTPPATGGTERKARPVEAVERVTVDEEEAKERVLMHTFEKVETLDEHRGEIQRMDGSDELDDHLEALDEVDLRQLVRGGEPAGSLYRAEIGIDADIPDVSAETPAEAGIPYDEWDARAGRYRAGWCTVYPAAWSAADRGWAGPVLTRERARIDVLRRRLEVARTRPAWVGRQRDGEEIDLDAVVDDIAQRRAGRAPGERRHARQVRRRRSHATTVLMDVSLSSDGWVAGRRVLDVTREAVLVLGEVAEALGDPLQVLAFASHTRNRCRVWTVRDWADPWAVGRARLGALRPMGYTRIGPALRHAATSLAKTPADRRLLLVVTDGKPTDYDRYEGRHGVADVRQAVREAEAKGVIVHGLTIDDAVGGALPAMFGTGAWHLLRDPAALPDTLATVFGRITRR